MSYQYQASKRRYANWNNMMSRCYNKDNQDYARYGGRGVKVCDEWQDRKVYYKYLSTKPEGTSIDRIDNNGDYSPENCRWATPKEQALNRRSNRLIEFNGEIKSLYEWGEHFGIKGIILTQRLNAYGWSIDKALTVGRTKNV